MKKLALLAVSLIMVLTVNAQIKKSPKSYYFPFCGKDCYISVYEDKVKDIDLVFVSDNQFDDYLHILLGHNCKTALKTLNDLYQAIQEKEDFEFTDKYGKRVAFSFLSYGGLMVHYRNWAGTNVFNPDYFPKAIEILEQYCNGDNPETIGKTE